MISKLEVMQPRRGNTLRSFGVQQSTDNSGKGGNCLVLGCQGVSENMPERTGLAQTLP